MRVFIITLSVLVLSPFSYAQERISHLEEGEIYKVSINLKDNGYLANLTDSSMQVSDIKCRFGARAGNKVYNYYDVERFSIKRSGDKLRRVLWSSGFGLITGILTSLVPVQNESNSWETTTTTMKIPVGTGAIIGLLGGAAVGLFTGTIKNHYSISKKKTAFRSAYTDLIQ